MNRLVRGDCLYFLRSLPPGSVDLVLADPPYGITDCAWDRIIDPECLFAAFEHALKPNGAAVVFGQQPFATTLINASSTTKLKFRYEWIWSKTRVTGFLNANRAPLRAHENILVFYRQSPVYNPQGLRVNDRAPKAGRGSSVYGKYTEGFRSTTTGYPRSILAPPPQPNSRPAEKPLNLLEFLIRTYSDEGDTVVDPCMGLGSTGLAASICSRKFIGIEIDRARFQIAKNAITEQMQAAA